MFLWFQSTSQILGQIEKMSRHAPGSSAILSHFICGKKKLLCPLLHHRPTLKHPKIIWMNCFTCCSRPVPFFGCSLLILQFFVKLFCARVKCSLLGSWQMANQRPGCTSPVSAVVAVSSVEWKMFVPVQRNQSPKTHKSNLKEGRELLPQLGWWTSCNFFWLVFRLLQASL